MNQYTYGPLGRVRGLTPDVYIYMHVYRSLKVIYVCGPVGREREPDGCGLTSNPIRDATEYIYITIYMYVYRLFET